MGTTTKHPMKHPMSFAGRALVAAAVCMAAVGACYASDGTITITGAVVNETCTINAGGSGSSSFALLLPKVSPSSFTVASPTAGRTQFSIALSGCQNILAPGTVFPYFESGATINAAGRLINGGSATNLDVELLNGAAAMDLSKTSGNQGAGSVNVSGGTGTLTYYAQYRATNLPTAVGIGSVSTSVTYTIVYP